MQETQQTVFDFLRAHRKAVLANVSQDGTPKASLMLYAADEDLRLYFGTKKSFNKYEALLQNPKVSIVVVEEGIDPKRAVEVQGEVVFIPENETAGAVEFFDAHNPSAHYVREAEDFVMFTVVPKSTRWLDATSGKLVSQEVTL